MQNFTCNPDNKSKDEEWDYFEGIWVAYILITNIVIWFLVFENVLARTINKQISEILEHTFGNGIIVLS